MFYKSRGCRLTTSQMYWSNITICICGKNSHLYNYAGNICKLSRRNINIDNKDLRIKWKKHGQHHKSIYFTQSDQLSIFTFYSIIENQNRSKANIQREICSSIPPAMSMVSKYKTSYVMSNFWVSWDALSFRHAKRQRASTITVIAKAESN